LPAGVASCEEAEGEAMRGVIGLLCVVLLVGCASHWVPLRGVTVGGAACLSQDTYVRALMAELAMRDYPPSSIQVEQASFRVPARHKRGVIATDPFFPQRIVDATTYFDVHVTTDNRVTVDASGHYVRGASPARPSGAGATKARPSRAHAPEIHVILEEERQDFVRLIEKLTPPCDAVRAPSTEI